MAEEKVFTVISDRRAEVFEVMLQDLDTFLAERKMTLTDYVQLCGH